MRRFFIPADQMAGPEPALTGSDAHHLSTVLRLSAGDRIIVFDGIGHQYQARITSVARTRVRLALEGAIPETSESALDLTLALGILKEKKMDGLVRQLTELGATRLVPFRANRSVPIPKPERLEARYRRWEKLSHEAMKQCGRSRPLHIAPVTSFEAALETARSSDLKLICWEQHAGLPPLDDTPELRPETLFLMIGPEGGFEPAEIETARTAGFHAISLGPRILRAETAALTACALVQFRFGDMGQKLVVNPEGV
jgi:16S rRNA (uracil1498-N3)-methyltransferase